MGYSFSFLGGPLHFTIYHLKKIMKNILLGVGIGCTIFAVIGIAFDIIGSGTFQLLNWSYTKMAIGSMIVGIGFSVPSVIYDNDKLSLGIQTLVHMGIGSTVFIIVAFTVGWIPVAAGWLICIPIVLGQLLIAFLIWLAFASYYKKLAKKMSDKIQNN